jgi:hypothetical protein
LAVFGSKGTCIGSLFLLKIEQEGDEIMTKNTYISLTLIGLGGIIGALAVFIYNAKDGHDERMVLLLLLAFASVTIGAILAFSQWLNRLVKPVVDELREDIEDDIQDIKQRRLTSTQFMVVAFGVLSLVFTYLVFRFQKFEATWGQIPVVVPTILVIVIGTWIVVRTEWFQDRVNHTPVSVFLIPVTGILLSMILGISFTEDIRHLRSAQKVTEYNTYQPSELSWIYILGDASAHSGSGISLPACTDEKCGAVYLLIALVVITFVLVVGSAFIPHFWLFSGCIFEAIIAIIVIHEIRVRQKVSL